jgi:hypothetical protein
MPEIRNRLNQRVLVDLADGKSIVLLAQGTSLVSEQDLVSPHLKRFIDQGKIAVMPEPKNVKRDHKPKKEQPL